MSQLGSRLFFFLACFWALTGISRSLPNDVRFVIQESGKLIDFFPLNFIFPCNTDTYRFCSKLGMVSKVSKMYFFLTITYEKCEDMKFINSGN